MTQHSTTQRGAAQHRATRHATARHTTSRHCTAPHHRAGRTAAQHRTARRSTAKHSTTQHGTPKHTTAPKQGTLTVGLNPIKPPHIPERKGTRPQPWDSTTPAHHARARGHHTPVGTTLPPPSQLPLLRAPHTPAISVHRPPRHHQSTQEEHPPHNPPATSTRDTPGPTTSHPRDHSAPPSPAKPNQDHPHINVDAPDLACPPRHTPPDPGHPPLRPATISDPDLLRATLQGRALDTPLGWYRLQKSWTKLTVKALRDLATQRKGLHEPIVGLFLWRARQHTGDQHIWIPSIQGARK